MRRGSLLVEIPEHAKILNDLVSTCRDSEEGFGKAAKGAPSDELREHLMKFVQQRHDLNAAPAERGHGGGVLHRGWVDLEQRIRPKDDKTTLKHYTGALEQETAH